MRFLAVLLMVGLASSTISASAEDTPKLAAKKSNPERMICREDDEIGTRVRKRRICMTAAQWKQVSQQIDTDLSRRQTQLAKPGE